MAQNAERILREGDELCRKRLKRLIDRKEKIKNIIGGFHDPYGDSEAEFCSKCGTVVFIRPYVKSLLRNGGLSVPSVLCPSCAKKIHGQKLEEYIEEGVREWRNLDKNRGVV